MVVMTDTTADTPAIPSDQAWQFLARLVRERREYIGLSQEELVQYGGPGKSTVGKFENARQRSYPARTQQQMEKALGWERGSIRTLLELAEKHDEAMLEAIAADYIEEVLPDLTLGDIAEVPVRRASQLRDDELLAELTYRMKRYAADAETPPTRESSNIVALRPDPSFEGHEPPLDAAADETGEPSKYEREADQDHGDDNHGR